MATNDQIQPQVQTRDGDSSSSVTETSEIITLVDGKLHYLPNVYELDGRVTTHPNTLRGFAPQNSYLLVEGDHALLLDTGFSVHERGMIERLRRLITPGMRLSVLVIRIGEFYGICNVRPIVEAFDVDCVYGKNAYDNPALAEDFRPEYAPWGSHPGAGWIGDVKGHVITGDSTIDVDPRGRRRLEAFPPPLRLLPTHWVYDEATKTMFTSDAFTHTWRDVASGPWTIRDTADSPTVSEIHDFMVGNRFWWLPGARSEPISRRIEQIFNEYDVETIAPAYGCVLTGRDVVQHHVQSVLQVLEQARLEPLTDVRAGSGPSF